MALYRHDLQVDLTRERDFTPSPEAQKVVRGLHQPVQLTYFYQKRDPAGRAAAAMVQRLGRRNPQLQVEAADTDAHPALANELGVQVFNTTIVRAADRRIEVITADEEEIALAILRAVWARKTTICFAAGTASTTSRISSSIRISRGSRDTATIPGESASCRCGSMASAGCV